MSRLVPPWQRDGGRLAGVVVYLEVFFFFFQAEDGIRDDLVTGVQTCALPIFFFALGHSTVVILATAGIAATATAMASRFDAFRNAGGMIGTLVSTLFLFVIEIGRASCRGRV